MPDPTQILNWRRIRHDLTSSGQPSEAQLGEIAALGVTHIVNLGLHDHRLALADEAESVARLGMNYTHIPVDFDAPTEQDFQDFCAVMASMADRTCHVHCIINARVTAFLYRYNRDILGGDEKDARAVLESVWQPGGVWAAFIGDDVQTDQPSRYAGRDY